MTSNLQTKIQDKSARVAVLGAGYVGPSLALACNEMAAALQAPALQTTIPVS